MHEAEANTAHSRQNPGAAKINPTGQETKKKKSLLWAYCGFERPFVDVTRAHAANKLHELFQVELVVAIRVHLVNVTAHLAPRVEGRWQVKCRSKVKGKGQAKRERGTQTERRISCLSSRIQSSAFAGVFFLSSRPFPELKQRFPRRGGAPSITPLNREKTPKFHCCYRRY